MVDDARAPVPVHAWPACAAQALTELRSGRAMTVISVHTPETELRHRARQNIRRALQEALGTLLQRPAASIPFISLPGQAITMDLPKTHIALSVSHAAGLSVAAIRVGGAVGIDLMRIEPGADDLPDWARVTHDYLGPQTCRQLSRLAPAHRAAAFARAWTRREAGLKSFALALTEWTPALEHQLATGAVTALALPESYCGALATR